MTQIIDTLTNLIESCGTCPSEHELTNQSCQIIEKLEHRYVENECIRKLTLIIAEHQGERFLLATEQASMCHSFSPLGKEEIDLHSLKELPHKDFTWYLQDNYCNTGHILTAYGIKRPTYGNTQ